jgi:hypothetical protein
MDHLRGNCRHDLGTPERATADATLGKCRPFCGLPSAWPLLRARLSATRLPGRHNSYRRGRSLEWAQNLVPGRDGWLKDFLFKAAGVIVGLVAAHLVQLALDRRRSRLH